MESLAVGNAQNHTKYLHSKNSGSAPQWNGNISQMTYGYAAAPSGSAISRTFNYTYDNPNRQTLTASTQNMVSSILETIKAVDRSPSVAQLVSGPHKAQRVSKKKSVAQ